MTKIDPPIYDQNGVLTTFAMDGLFTQEDIDNRHFVMAPCNNKKCKEWSKMDLRDYVFKCPCGNVKFDGREMRSIRSYETMKTLPKEKKIQRRNKRA